MINSDWPGNRLCSRRERAREQDGQKARGRVEDMAATRVGRKRRRRREVEEDDEDEEADRRG